MLIPALRRLFSTNVGVASAIVIFNAILIGVLWASLFARVQEERRDAIRAATERNDNLAVAFEQFTGRTMESADAHIQQLIRTYAGSGGSMDLESFLADFTINDKVIIGFVLADEHGNAESSAYLGRSVKPINVRDREHFRIHIGQDSGKAFVGKPVVGRLSGEWVVPVTRRINKADGTFGGVAMALIEPGRFTDVLHDAKRRPLDIISLVGLDGITRARLKGTTASTGEYVGKSPLFAEQARRPVGNYSSTGQLDNVPRLFSYRTLPDYQVMVTVGTAEADVLAGAVREEMQYHWTAGLISAFIAVFTVLLIRVLERQRGAAAAVAGSEARFRAIFEQAAVGIAHTSLDRRYLQVNQKFCDMLGYSRDELLAMRSNAISLPSEQETGPDFARALAGEISTFSREKRYVRKDGSVLWAHRTVSLVRDSAGKPLYFIRIVEDISERKQAQERVAYLAQYDSLTGLPNRNLFRDRLALAIARANREGHPVALLFLDLDRLKVINDSLGHTAGDEVLQAAAGLLRGSLRDVDTIARLGGDEFTIILEDVASPEKVAAVAEKIKKAFSEPFRIHDREFFVTASIGISLYPHDASDAESLLKVADVAMYESKRTGRNTYTFYAAEMNAQAGERLHMEALLRHALDRREFLLLFRPRVETATRKIVGVEALLRWNSSALGLVPPDRFMLLAEETGLIEPIGEWVIQTACAQNRAWQDRGVPPLLLSVNLSLRQFRHKNLVEVVAAALEKSGLAPHLLEFAVTESVIMENIHENVESLKALRRLGVTLAIDDFGTGNSSLGHLARLPMDTLKIDSSFVTGMTTGPEDLALVSTIINLAHSLRFKVVAEGVETEEQSRLLQLLNCDEMQGFLFGEPQPVEIFEASLLAAPPVLAAPPPAGALSSTAEVS